MGASKLILLASMGLCASCESESTTTQPAPSEPEPAPAALRADNSAAAPVLPGEYALLRANVVDLLNEANGSWAQELANEAKADGELDVAGCAYDWTPDQEVIDIPPVEDSLIRLATEVEQLRQLVSAAGFPPAAYDSALNEFEANGARRIAGGDPDWVTRDERGSRWSKVVDALNTYRDRDPTLPRVVASGACGEGENPVYIRSDPDGARVWIATRFSFLLCKRKGWDPWDQDACPRWREVDLAQPEELSGTYMYQAMWPDGRHSDGMKNVDGDGDGSGLRADDGLAIFTVRPS